jgi:hypothetical protein
LQQRSESENREESRKLRNQVSSSESEDDDGSNSDEASAVSNVSSDLADSDANAGLDDKGSDSDGEEGAARPAKKRQLSATDDEVEVFEVVKLADFRMIDISMSLNTTTKAKMDSVLIMKLRLTRIILVRVSMTQMMRAINPRRQRSISHLIFIC